MEDALLGLHLHTLIPILHICDYAVVEHRHILKQAVNELQVATCTHLRQAQVN